MDAAVMIVTKLMNVKEGSSIKQPAISSEWLRSASPRYLKDKM